MGNIHAIAWSTMPDGQLPDEQNNRYFFNAKVYDSKETDAWIWENINGKHKLQITMIPSIDESNKLLHFWYNLFLNRRIAKNTVVILSQI